MSLPFKNNLFPPTRNSDIFNYGSNRPDTLDHTCNYNEEYSNMMNNPERMFCGSPNTHNMDYIPSDSPGQPFDFGTGRYNGQSNQGTNTNNFFEGSSGGHLYGSDFSNKSRRDNSDLMVAFGAPTTKTNQDTPSKHYFNFDGPNFPFCQTDLFDSPMKSTTAVTEDAANFNSPMTLTSNPESRCFNCRECDYCCCQPNCCRPWSRDYHKGGTSLNTQSTSSTGSSNGPANPEINATGHTSSTKDYSKGITTSDKNADMINLDKVFTGTVTSNKMTPIDDTKKSSIYSYQTDSFKPPPTIHSRETGETSADSTGENVSNKISTTDIAKKTPTFTITSDTMYSPQLVYFCPCSSFEASPSIYSTGVGETYGYSSGTNVSNKVNTIDITKQIPTLTTASDSVCDPDIIYSCPSDSFLASYPFIVAETFSTGRTNASSFGGNPSKEITNTDSTNKSTPIVASFGAPSSVYTIKTSTSPRTSADAGSGRDTETGVIKTIQNVTTDSITKMSTPIISKPIVQTDVIGSSTTPSSVCPTEISTPLNTTNSTESTETTATTEVAMTSVTSTGRRSETTDTPKSLNTKDTCRPDTPLRPVNPTNDDFCGLRFVQNRYPFPLPCYSSLHNSSEVSVTLNSTSNHVTVLQSMCFGPPSVVCGILTPHGNNATSYCDKDVNITVAECVAQTAVIFIHGFVFTVVPTGHDCTQSKEDKIKEHKAIIDQMTENAYRNAYCR